MTEIDENANNFVDGDEVDEVEAGQVADAGQGDVTDDGTADANEQAGDKPAEESTGELSDEAKQGIIGDLQGERVRRQRAEADLLALQDQVKEQGKATTETSAAAEPGDPDPHAAVPDEEMDRMLPSEIRKLDRNHYAWQQRENSRVQQFNQNQHMAQIEQVARVQFSKETMGEGLDYESVIKTGGAWLTDVDKASILRSNDQAGAAYDLCVKRCPHLTAKQTSTSTSTSTENKTTAETEKVAEKVNTPATSLEEQFVSIDKLAEDFVS